MNYETKARPIRTNKELEHAISAGASLEFTACGCSYDVPDWWKEGSEGWIEFRKEIEGNWIPWKMRIGEFTDPLRVRAFYPKRKHFLSRLALWRKAA